MPKPYNAGIISYIYQIEATDTSKFSWQLYELICSGDDEPTAKKAVKTAEGLNLVNVTLSRLQTG